MAVTYTEIASVTVGSGGSSSITFSSIPNTYTDFKIVGSTRDDRGAYANSPVTMTHINGSAVSGVNTKNVNTNGSVVFSENASELWAGESTRVGQTANTFSNWECYIPNYAGSQYKSMSIEAVTENNATEASDQIAAALWQNTAAIASFRLTPNYGTAFQQYSTFYLYGIKNS